MPIIKFGTLVCVIQLFRHTTTCFIIRFFRCLQNNFCSDYLSFDRKNVRSHIFKEIVFAVTMCRLTEMISFLKKSLQEWGPCLSPCYFCIKVVTVFKCKFASMLTFGIDLTSSVQKHSILWRLGLWSFML